MIAMQPFSVITGLMACCDCHHLIKTGQLTATKRNEQLSASGLTSRGGTPEPCDICHQSPALAYIIGNSCRHLVYHREYEAWLDSLDAQETL